MKREESMTSVKHPDQKVDTASRDEIRLIQFQKLNTLLKKVFASNSFYRVKFNHFGITSSEIQSIDDLHKLPFTMKREFEEDQEKHPPFGTNLTEPLENYTQYHQTSGTTGRPLKFLDTRESWDWRGRVACYILEAAGVKKSDRVLFPFNFGPYTAFWTMYEGASQIGALVIPTGGWNSSQRLECMIENKATVILTTPTYALALAETANKCHVDIANSDVRTIFLSGEPGALIQAIREKIENLWNAKCYDYIGMTEVGSWGFQCSGESFGVHVIENEFIAEVIDPRTNQPVSGEEAGELVLTNLGRACMPAIRYRTGDLVKVKKGLCPCGRTFLFLEGGILGRKDEMVIIRGVNVFPSALKKIIESHIQPGDEYQIVTYKRKNIDELAIKLELSEKGKNEIIQKNVQDEIKTLLNLRVEIEAVPKGTLPKFDYKAKRFIDRRKEAE
jgi:phenylacetate-CoA ligase